MEKDQLELKRLELNTLIDNFNLTSEFVVKKAREFEELANKTYGIKDGAYWMQRYKRIEELLKQVNGYCPARFKSEIAEALKVE